MQEPIKVTYEYTDSPMIMMQWLRSLPDLFAADFEVAVKLTSEERTVLELELPEASYLRAKAIQSILNTTALGRPSRTVLTHFSFAASESHGYVVILSNDRIRNTLLNWLVSTDKTQIWHNASFDFQHIHYHTKQFPKSYEDSMLRAKSILNHVDTSKAKAGLKELAGHWYGAWAVAADYFSLDNLYDEDLIKYAAIDACASYKLWHSISDYVASNS